MNNWQTPKNIPSLDHKTAHIWLIKISAWENIVNDLSNILSPKEQQKAHRFVTTELQQNFTIVHSLLRILLSSYLKCATQEITFSHNKYGKPKLINSAIHFNISHSSDLALFAINYDFPLGVDVEKLRDDLEPLEIAERFFAPAETKALKQIPESYRIRAFFNCWTRKEAFIKATGQGLSFGLDKFVVDITDKQEDLLLQPLDNKEKWSLYALPVAQQYCAALSTARSITTKKYLYFAPTMPTLTFAAASCSKIPDFNQVEN